MCLALAAERPQEERVVAYKKTQFRLRHWT